MTHPDTGTSTVTQNHAGYGPTAPRMVTLGDGFLVWLGIAHGAGVTDEQIARAVGRDRSYVTQVRGGTRRRVGREFVTRFAAWFASRVTPEMIAASAGIDVAGEDMTLQTIQANKGAPGEGR